MFSCFFVFEEQFEIRSLTDHRASGRLTTPASLFYLFVSLCLCVSLFVCVFVFLCLFVSLCFFVFWKSSWIFAVEPITGPLADLQVQ